MTDQSTPQPDVETLPVPPPAGLTKHERTLWRRQEALRVAHATGQASWISNRADRREFTREAQQEHRNQVAQEREELQPDRNNGALIIMAVIAVGVIVAWLWPSNGEQAAPANPVPLPPAATAPAVTTTPAATPTTPVLAGSGSTAPYTQVMLAWWALTCPHTPDQWGPAQPLMTGEAWAEAATTAAPIVDATWVCSNLTVTADSAVRADGTVLVKATADRTITIPNTPPVTERATDLRVVHLVGGQLLVGQAPRE